MADVITGKAKVGLMAAPGPENTPETPSQPFQARNANTLAETRNLAAFPVNVPAYTAGYAFLQAGVLQAPKQAVVMTFAGEAKRLGFQVFQAPSVQYQSGPHGKVSYYVVADNLNQTQVGAAVGARSALPPNPSGLATTSLVWEKGDVLYHLIGHGLSDQEITRIATSI
jgi:hypothetical protein